jgi:hypothetical protein
VGDDAGRGGHDRRAEATEDARQAVLLRVHAAARLRHALEVGDDATPVARELELDDERLVRQRLALVVLQLDDAVVGDVALLLEDARDLLLHARGGHGRGVVQRTIRIPNPGQHVCDGVSEHLSVSLPARLRHARNGALVSELAQADPANAELAKDRPRTAALVAA